MDDRAVVSWQLGRSSRPFRRVALRCPHGFAAVTEQPPYGEGGEPFPTTFYLTCPWLVGAIARVEAAGGVRRFEALVASDDALRASVARAHEEQRSLRPELPGGIGGTRDDSRLKCLHAHAAYALGRPGYALGERVLEEAGPRWCDDARCAAALTAR